MLSVLASTGFWDTVGSSIMEGLKAFIEWFTQFMQDFSCLLLGAALDLLPLSLQPSDAQIAYIARGFNAVDCYVPLGFAIDLVCAYITFYAGFYALKIVLMLL